MEHPVKRNLGGRPPGSKSTDTLVYQEFFVKKKFVIPEKELWALSEAKEQYEFYRDNVASGRYSPMEDKAPEYLKIYQNGIKEIANRIYPKLKAIEHHRASPLQDKTPEEKLAALDQYRLMLIEEINESKQ